MGQELLRIQSYARVEMNIDPATITADQYNEACTGAREAYLARIFLENANRSLYGGLAEQLRLNYVLKQNHYPRTVLAVYAMLQTYSPPALPNNNHNQPQVHAQFVQGTTGEGSNGQRNGGNRNGRGRGNGNNGGGGSSGVSQPHDSQSTASSRSDNTNSSQVAPYSNSLRPMPSANVTTNGPEISLQQTISSLSRTSVILDLASSIDLFVNPDLLYDIQDSPNPITIMSNTGKTKISQFGYLPGYPEPIWYHPAVFSLRNLSRHFLITFDSETTPHFRITISDTHILPFFAGDHGLYTYECGSNWPAPTSHQSTLIFTLLTSAVDDKKAEYTQRAGIE